MSDLLVLASLLTGCVLIVIGLWKCVSAYRERKSQLHAFSTFSQDFAQFLAKVNSLEIFEKEGESFRAEIQDWSSYLPTKAEPLKLQFQTKRTELQRAFEKQEREKQRRRQEAIDQREALVGRVFEVFLNQEHTDSIPEEFKNFPEDIIEEAEQCFEDARREEGLREREEEQELEERKEAYKFVANYHGLPANYAKLSPEKQWHYNEALQLLKEGKLQQTLATLREQDTEKPEVYITNQDYIDLAGGVESGKEREKQLLTKKFYFETELGNGEQRFLKSFHKYETCKVSNFGDGFLHALFRKEGQNEGTQHFCTKHLFAKLHPGAQVEVRDWWKNEVDVVFKKGQKKLALEIETGSNKADYVRDKISNLCRAYDQIIVVVPRKVLPKYRAYHDGQKVFVLTAKQAKEHVLEWYK